MKRDPAGYRSAVHHLAWLATDDDPSLREEMSELATLDAVVDITDVTEDADDGRHCAAYVAAAADLLDLASADAASESDRRLFVMAARMLRTAG